MIPGYRIIRELGRGGMAVVYLAEQESLGREVALKVLGARLAADDAFVERFLREVRIAGSFRHRALVPVYDAGHAGDELYLAMEYLPGGSAGALRGGDPENIRRCLIDVAAGLAYAHDKGVVHRDIKPENILRREDGSFVLTDFGIARSSAHTHELTAPQAAIGTPSYMSPEQWRAQAIDGRADLYALGVVAYELLTGNTPFHGEDGWSLGMQHMTAPRPRLPVALAEWQPLLDRLLAVDPEARYADARELIAALGGKPETTPGARAETSPSRLTPAPAPATTPVGLRARDAGASRSRVRAWALAGATLLALAGIGYVALKRGAPVAATPAAVETRPAAPPAPAPKPAPSVAVLPFRLLSSEPGDALFADGLTEEILGSLAAIPELKVPGRTSSFAWKGRDADSHEIGRALGVAHLLEGSVRRAGKSLRISANLLAVDEGRVLWTQTFDRSDGDIFAIQNEIALAVADKLAVTVGSRPLPTLARLPAEQRAAYLEAVGQFAQANTNTAEGAKALEFLRLLGQGEASGPDLFVRLIQGYADQLRFSRVPATQALAQIEGVLETLRTRFPGSDETLFGEALLAQSRADAQPLLSPYVQALAKFDAVLARSPNNADATTQAAFTARVLFRLDEALRHARRAVELDPQNASAQYALANALGAAGRADEAIAAMEDLAQRFPDSSQRDNVSIFLAGPGRLADAALADRDCVTKNHSYGCLQLVEYLELLGFPDSARRIAAEESAASGKRDALALAALHDGTVPNLENSDDATWTSRIYLPLVMNELIAQGRLDAARSLVRRLLARFSYLKSWSDLDLDPDDIDPRMALPFTFHVMSGLLPATDPRTLARLQAHARQGATLPLKYGPWGGMGGLVGAQILVGDLDGAFRRLDAIADANPLNWQGWVISPSGRDMPTAKALRADPRFAAIWQRRAALIARERARLLQLWPELR